MLQDQNVTRSATQNLHSPSNNFHEVKKSQKSDQFLLVRHHSDSKSRRQSVSKPVFPRPSLKPDDFDLHINEVTDQGSEYDESEEEDQGVQRQKSMIHLALPPEVDDEFAIFLQEKPKPSKCIKPIWYRPFPTSPRVLKIRGLKELKKQLSHIHRELSESEGYWQTQIKMLRLLQSLVIAGISKHNGMTSFTNRLIPALQRCLQYGRAHWRVNIEACITVGFLATRLHREQFEHCALRVFGDLLTLFGIVSTDGIAIAAKITVLLILQNLHLADFILVITDFLKSQSCSLKNKSALVKSGCCELLAVIVQHWPVALVERHMATITDGIHQGLQDANATVRSVARRAFFVLKKYFIQDSLHLLAKLEPLRRQALVKAARIGGAYVDRLSIGAIEELLILNEGHDLDKTYAAAYHGALELTPEIVAKRGFADKATFIHSFGTDVLLDIPEWIETNDMINKSSDYLAMLPPIWNESGRKASLSIPPLEGKSGISRLSSHKKLQSASTHKPVNSVHSHDQISQRKSISTKATSHKSATEHGQLSTVRESSSGSYTYETASSTKEEMSADAEPEQPAIFYTPWRAHKSQSIILGKPDNREKDILVYKKHKNMPDKNTWEYTHKVCGVG